MCPFCKHAFQCPNHSLLPFQPFSHSAAAPRNHHFVLVLFFMRQTKYQQRNIPFKYQNLSIVSHILSTTSISNFKFICCCFLSKNLRPRPPTKLVAFEPVASCKHSCYCHSPRYVRFRLKVGHIGIKFDKSGTL